MIQNALAAQTSPRQKVIDAIKRMQADGVPEDQIQRVVAKYKRENNIVDRQPAQPVGVDTFRKANPLLDAMLAPSQQEPHHRLPGVVDSNPLAGLNPAGAFGGYSPNVRKVKANEAAAMEGANVSNEFQAKTRGVIEDNPVSNFIAGLDPTDVLIPSWKKGLVGHILGGVSGIANIPANVAGNVAVLYDPRASEEQQAKALGGIGWDLAGGAVTGKVLHEAGKIVKPVAAKAGDAIKALVSRGVPKKIAAEAVKAAEKERLNWTPPQDLPGYDAGVAPDLKAGLAKAPAIPPGTKRTESPGRPIWEQPKKQPRPLEDGESPFGPTTPYYDDMDPSELNLVSAAKSGGLSWQGISPKHAARLRKLGATADDLTGIRAEHAPLELQRNISSLNEGLTILMADSKRTDAELSAILRATRKTRQKLREQGAQFGTRGSLPTIQETLARPNPVPRTPNPSNISNSSPNSPEIPVGSKEPWRVKQGDWLEQEHAATIAELRRQLDQGDLATNKPQAFGGKAMSEAEQRTLVEDALKRLESRSGYWFEEKAQLHKSEVEQALKDKTLTPEEAQRLGHFDTYPDLAKKYGSKETQSVGGEVPVQSTVSNPETVSNTGNPVTPEPSATRHADTAEVRKLLGLDEYEKNPVSDAEMAAKASAHDPFEVAARVAKDGKASGDEVISMGVKLQELRQQMEAAKAANDGETWSKLFAKAEPLAEAIDKAGSQTGRDLRIRRLLVDNAYDTFGLTRRAEIEAKGEKIHPKVQKQLDDMAARISDLETELAQKQIKRQPKPMVDRITEIRARREQALADLLKSTSATSGLSYDQFEAGVRYLKTYVEEGVVRVEDLVGKMKESGVKWSDEDNAKAAKKAIGDYARDLNQGRSAFGERVQVKGLAGIEDPEIAKLRAKIDVEKLRADSLVRSLAPKNKVASVLTEGAGAIRAAKLSMDLGALLRQGFLGFTSNPKRWAQAIAKGVKAGGSDEAAMMLSNAINDHVLPDGRYAAPLRKQAGLQLTHYATGEFEEPFVAQWIRKVPVLGKAFAGSERLQSGFLNAMRASMFDDFAAKFPEATDQELKQWASYINNALGRSNLKSVHTAANVAFTSPRWAVSRFGVLADTVKAGVSPKSAASRQIVGEAVKAASVIYGGLLLAKERGYDVNLDYTSSDFLKARNGDQVTDFTGAMGPALRVILRVALSKKQGQTPAEEIGNYAVQRLSPAVTSAYQTMRGETLTGYQLDEQQKGWQAWAPLIASQWKQNVEQEGFAKGTVKMLGTEMVGVSQQNYPKPKPKPDRKTQR